MLLYIIVFALILLADQITKYYISNHFIPLNSVSLFGDFIYLTFVKNAGAAFGVLQNYQHLFIIVTSAILLIVLIYFFYSPRKDVFLKVSLVMIMAGGVGNLIDRIRQGYVIDFIDLKFWPVFNVSDMSVVIGSILLMYYILFKYKDEDKNVK